MMRTKSYLVRCLTLVGLLVMTVSPSLAGMPDEGQDLPLATLKIASNLGFLLTMQDAAAPLNPDSSLGRELARIRDTGLVEISARFESELSPAERAELESLGVVFQYVGDQPAQVGPFYGVLVPVDAVAALSTHPLTVWLEATWRPVVPAPLDVSLRFIPGITYLDAPAVWSMSSPFTGMPLTGHGVTVANFDTGIDVRHPAFLSGTYGTGYSNWDTNGDLVFTPGVDQIGGVILRYWDAQGDPANNIGMFDVWQDWVYGDANTNSAYDWGEPVYMAWDTDQNGILDAGEFLINRGNMISGIPSSKIAATLNAGGVQRTRGVDLEQTPADTNGHGTSVAGIIGAGAAHWSVNPVWPFARRYTGVAPDADLLVADRYNNSFSSYIPWADGLGAQVMLYEYGAWVQTYLDGSSNHESMMSMMMGQGILQVVPTGNLHCAGTWGCNPRHLQYALPPSVWFPHQFNVPNLSPSITAVWTSMLWMNTTNNMQVNVTTPGGFPTGVLPCVSAGSGWQMVSTGDGHDVWCERAVNSVRGTALYNLYIAKTGGGNITVGNWTMNVMNTFGSPQVANFYVADDATSWAFGAGWLNAGGGAEIHTATWPSTSDSSLGVASYATRANFIGTSGDLSWFSGRGPRFYDGARIVDVAAPGHYDIITPQSQNAPGGSLGAYNGTFGGTSAAGPHVAGLGALLYQYANGNTTSSHVGRAIMLGALPDGFTGPVPNDDWGYGKISGPGALAYMMHDLGDAPDSANSFSSPMTAYAGVQANFPTVYTYATGPVHWAAGSAASGPVDSCLGMTVSAEGEADLLFDEDGLPNIDSIMDVPDQDNFVLSPNDDGVPLPIPLAHCSQIVVPYDVQVVGLAIPRYVNVWFDWDHDGDWADVPMCPGSIAATEWAVQDEMSVLGSGFHPMVSAPFVPWITVSEDVPFENWMRISLAEMPSPAPQDGRGPVGGYNWGETEDYYLWLDPSLAKTAALSGDPLPGEEITYQITYNGTGNVIAVGAVISDVLPPEVEYVSSTPPGFYNPATRVVSWTINLEPDLMQVLDLVVQVTGVPSDTVTNTAHLLWGDTVWKRASATFHITGTAEPPIAFFTSTTPACVSDTIYFTNLSTGTPPLSFTWDLDGDGLPDSLDTHPTWHYDSPGMYTVTLTATNLSGFDVYTDIVTALQPLSALSITGPVSLLVDEEGTYTAVPSPPDATDPVYLWDSGDISITAIYSWPAPGLYTISLSASNDCGLLTATLEVLVSEPCISLTGVVIDGPASLLVGEVGGYLATPEPALATDPAYLWSNGSVTTSAVYSWTLPGSYEVVVTATNCDDVVVSDTLTVLVSDACISLTGVTITGPTSLQAGEEGLFLASLEPPTATSPAYLWSDGSTGASAAISWTVPGTYQVTITATNCQGVVVADTLEVQVEGEICVSLTGVLLEGPASLLVGEEGDYLVSPEPPTATSPAYLWSDGSTAASTAISWTVPGTYQVAVTATNCQDVVVTDVLEVLVSAECISLTGISVDGPAALLVGDAGTYLASPEPPTATNPSYLWSDGSTGASAIISWTLPGSYTVVVTATNCGDVSFSDQMIVLVSEEAVDYWIYLPLVFNNSD